MRTKLGFIGDNDLPGVDADAKFAVENGFEGLEYNYWGNFKELTAETVGAMRDLLDKHGVGCSMLGLWGWNTLSPDAAERDEAREMLRRAVEFAETLGAETLTTGGGQIPEASLEEHVEAFAEMFAPTLETVEAAGRKVALYAVHGASFLDSIEAYERLWEKLPTIGIKFDPANWQHHGDDYLAVARRCGNRIGHLHVKEHLYHGGELASQPPAGFGDIEWGKLFAFLYEHDYDGALSIEPHGAPWSRGEMRHKMLLLTQRYISRFLI